MLQSLSAKSGLACLLALAAFAPGVVAADDAARISRLETEVQQLRSQLDEQNRRIQRLEAELARRAGQPPQPQPRPRVVDMRTDAPAARGPQPWQSAAAWTRVKPGMEEAEVISILGEPTSAESVGALKSLFYRGGPLVGHVNLKEGRVVAVSRPAF